MSFNPTGTVTLRPASTDLFASPQEAGVTSVTEDSTLTLADLTVSGNPTFASFTLGSVTNDIVAKASGTQATGTKLTTAINRIVTCLTDGDSVVLPVAVQGMEVFVRNSGTKSAQVYGTSPATINGVATATGVALASGASARYYAITSAVWVS